MITNRSRGCVLRSLVLSLPTFEALHYSLDCAELFLRYPAQQTLPSVRVFRRLIGGSVLRIMGNTHRCALVGQSRFCSHRIKLYLSSITQHTLSERPKALFQKGL